MAATDALILEQVSAGMPMARDMTRSLLAAGGKRIRPRLVLLSARCFGWDGEDKEPLQLAAIIEYIHMATLLHDDVIDDSHQRRGQPTAQMIWGNSAAILVGDYLYSLAFQLMADLQTPGVLKRLATATHTIINGEIQQLSHRHDTHLDEAAYYTVIQAKTAELFSVATQLGAMVTRQSTKMIETAGQFGADIGLAYQLIDDALDYTEQDKNILGKDLGDDLAEGKLTLPLILALKHCNDQQRDQLETAIKSGDTRQLDLICAIVQASGALDATRDRAAKHTRNAHTALSHFPDNPHRNHLSELAQYLTQRLK